MIAPRSIIKCNITFEKASVNHTYYFFNDIKNIDLNLLNINKTYAKNTNAVIYEIKYIIVQSINIRILIEEFPFVLVLVIQMHTLLKKMKINT